MHSVVLMLFWSGFGASLQLWDGLSQPHSSMVTANPAVTVPHYTPCFFDDTVAMLHEAVGDDGELANNSLTLFGVCRASVNSSVLSELSEELKRNKRGLEVRNPAAVLVSEENDQEGIMLTFDLPQSPLLKLKLVLMLVFESPLTGGDLEVTFSGQFLQPNMQSACISEGTQYILLKGQSSEGNVEQKWRISAQTKYPDMKQNLKNIFIGGKSGSSLYMTPLLLFSAEQETITRRLNSSGWSPQTSFLCELKRFLGAVLPQGHVESPLYPLDSLQSLPPLPLGLSSSEILLSGIINSSAPTIFSFNSWSSSSPVRREQLALSLSLLEELRQRLEKNEMEMMELIRQEKVTHRAAEKLGRLKDLSGFQRKDPAIDGESQYCAFFLLKALQTVVHAYDMQKRLRAIRADSIRPVRENNCGLRSLTVGLQKHFMSPPTANINNCQGSCAFPLTSGNNHAVLLNYHIEGGGVDERAPCCVPVAYDPLQVLDFSEEGTFLSIKPDMIAKECRCH